jgi:hypothetical protein
MQLHRAALAFIIVALITPALPAQKDAPVKGFVKVNGKTTNLRHGLVVTGPDSFDEHEEVAYIFLTPKPIPPADVAKAESVADLRKLMSSGVRVQLDSDNPSAHLTILHPALGDDALSTGAGFGYKPTSSGPERYTATLLSFGADRDEDEELFNHKLRYDISYDLTVTRRFPVTPKPALSAKAKKVGPGGGEPGKAYLANCAKASNLPKTAKELEKRLEKEGQLPTDADLEEMSKERGKKITRQDAVEMLFELVKLGSELAPKNCKVLGGGYDENLAILQVEADMLGDRSRTEAILERVDGVWTVTKHGTWTSAK